MIFAAIDPGAVSAAVAIFNDTEVLLVDDIPTLHNMLDGIALAEVLADLQIKQLVIENVHSMPKQGVASTFKFGMGTGIIHGIASGLKLPVTLVAPTRWKAFHRLNADKEQARALAIRKWPDQHRRLKRKRDANRAEALLIGDWYYRTLPGSNIPEIFA